MRPAERGLPHRRSPPVAPVRPRPQVGQLGTQAPPTANMIGVRVSLTVAYVDKSILLYRDKMGMKFLSFDQFFPSALCESRYCGESTCLNSASERSIIS